MLLDVVIDEAEIPDVPGDPCARPRRRRDRVAAPRPTARRATECRAVGDALELAVDGAAAPIRLVDAGLAFPPGNGGLSTMRIVCGFEAPLVTPIAAGTSISFRDGFEAARIGWREMTVVGSRRHARGAGRADASARAAGSPPIPSP